MTQRIPTTGNLLTMVLTATLALVAALAATGCAEVPLSRNTAYVVANVTGSAVDPSAASADFERAVAANDFIGIVNADGDPGVVGSAGIVGSTSGSTSAKRAENETWLASLNQALTGVVADDPECDLLASIDCARRCLNADGAYPDAERRIVVLSNGFSTAGVLDMRDGLLFADPADVVSFYANEMPDLEGISVDWYGLGNTCEPQAAPTTSTRAVMEEFWTRVLTEGCGAQSVTFHDVNAVQDPAAAADRPAVTAIELPEVQTLEASAVAPGTTVTLDSQTLYFRPNEAEFVDRDGAVAVLRPYADALNADGSLSVSIVGSTASGHDRDFLARLSGERAQATAAVLEGMGVDAGRISCSGEGSWGADHIDDWADEGETELDPVAAAANRHITLSFS